jgi:hypothetical protein
VKADINSTFLGLSFDGSLLPVPPQNRLTFCGTLDTSVIDDLGRDLLKAARIGTVIIVLLALVLLAGNCALQWYQWRCLKRHLEYTRQAWLTDPTLHHDDREGSTPTVMLTDHNLLMLRANSSHPLLTRIANVLTARLGLSPSQHIHLQWFFSYIFHPPALACFLIGFFGLLSVQLQLLAVGPLAAKYADRAQASAADFSAVIVSSVNQSMQNQSAAYAAAVNGQVDTIQNTINEGLFGWVNVTTTTLNTTISTFYADIQGAVDTVFNGTILEAPANAFLQCFIGSKVDAIENALTFLNNNLHVDMPRVNSSVLMLSQAQVDEATQPIAQAAIGGGDGDNEGLLGRLVKTYVASLEKERVMFAIFMALWGIVVLVAIGVILWHSYGRPLMERRKKREWAQRQRGLLALGNIPFPSEDGLGEKRSDNFFDHPPLDKPAPKDKRPSPFSRFAAVPLGFKNPGPSLSSLLDRAKGLLPSREAKDTPPVPPPRPRPNPNPNLRISVTRLSDIYSPTSPSHEQNVPKSAWSVSTDGARSAPTVSWATRISPPQPLNARGRAMGLPPNPAPAKSRAQNVPVYVDEVDSGENLAGLGVPLHSAFAGASAKVTPPPVMSPIYSTQHQRLAPPPAHRRAPSGPPPQRSLTQAQAQAGARRSTSAERLPNPFVTPFDDEEDGNPF